MIFFCQKFISGCVFCQKNFFHEDGTLGNFFLVVFCQNFFMEMGQ